MYFLQIFFDVLNRTVPGNLTKKCSPGGAYSMGFGALMVPICLYLASAASAAISALQVYRVLSHYFKIFKKLRYMSA